MKMELNRIKAADLKAECGILAGEDEILGTRCLDGGRCHHRCETSCFRKECCVPLTVSRLKDDWTAPDDYLCTGYESNT
ncbi:hypothetical protein [Pseudomonas phage vB_PaeM_PAO1_Ab03]|nr:hypothetical protein VC54_gp029 [Pseudomonas phage vB_PaeM_PAO1_Ab03]CEF89134.1 hypothetical protein [Pseudomonas phage vB_PaeM_PAO1_Ab03]CEQ38306.1 hypothetical protein [Pseudomonas phage vB_PaeM_PAO1_Ab04]CEQ38338.1 hypothetical protein [Pseudomonas phage vB_PaeM_PAO1_Ab06]